MEAHWETIKGAPKYLFVIPDESNERNLVELIPIPGFLSLLATHDFKGEVKGLKDFRKQDRPPVFISYFSFQLMVGLGIYFVLIMLYGWFKRDRLQDYPKYLRLVLYSIPLPYIACELGWTLAEVGRQPWIVYGILRTNEAASPLVAGQVAVTLLAFVVVYATIGIIGFGMITRFARQGIKTN